MSDPNGAPITGAETTTMESKSTWTSTSSAETELDNFWHDSVSPRLIATDQELEGPYQGTTPTNHTDSLCRTIFTLHKTLH